MSTTTTTTATTPAGGERTEHGRQLLARSRTLIEPVLRTAVDGLPEVLRLMAGYHFGWWDTAGTPTRADSGKALRPALVLAAAAACGAPPSAGVHAAAAVELAHNFTLLHDDVMDADVTRRGRATVWSVWGVPNAILVGDTLHALAIRVLTDERLAAVGPAIARLESCVVELCRGEQEDCAFEGRPEVGMAECVRMAIGKTGALMGCCCALGALCAGADNTVVAGLDRFGREMGLAFQLIDDVLGIWGDPMTTRKPAGADLAARKKSLPVVAALTSGTPAGRELARLYHSPEPMTPAMVARATELAELAGGREWAQQEAARRWEAALDGLPDRHAAADLVALAELAVRRDR
ncbi:family 2 encapsulin nanocompartment cargo protein polyprenyl transferase [Crossiella sp. SN42]|uniref:family 2 encapsulin nanocompartment cargo protein polyprenyl transferase n=1 Tax=Crossiella sp. SN42 TaxID=2944808 RepID=UPI0035AB91C7